MFGVFFVLFGGVFLYFFRGKTVGSFLYFFFGGGGVVFFGAKKVGTILYFLEGFLVLVFGARF
jgi:hypothetical protein